MLFTDMIKIYKNTVIYNYTFECLLSNDKSKQQYATEKLSNLKTQDDVLLFIASI